MSRRDDRQQVPPTDLSRVRPGQTVTLHPQSPLYKGQYECSVLETTPERVRVSMPMEAGKLVLVPVGTTVYAHVKLDGELFRFEAQITDRRGGAERSLVLSLPPEPPAYLTPRDEEAACRVIAITSGKGGVGKTAFALNLGAALASAGRRVCLIDGDLGTANIDVLLNMTPRYNLAHVIAGAKNIFEVLLEGPHGLVVLPGGSGLQELTTLDGRRFEKLQAEFRRLEQYADVLLIDTGSGLSRAVTNFVQAADETIIVTTPEPHAITDAYALMKVATQDDEAVRFRLVVNRVQQAREARDIARKMIFAGKRFLEVRIEFLGYVVDDPNVGAAIRRRQDLLTAYPNSAATENVGRIATRLLSGETETPHPAGEGDAAGPRRTFLQRFRDLFAR